MTRPDDLDRLEAIGITGMPMIPSDSTLYQALIAIDQHGLGIALLTVDGDHLAGVLTDGDIRRALIKSGSLSEACLKYATLEPLTVGVDAPRSLVMSMIDSHGLAAVPIIDSDGVLIGVHTVRELISAAVRPNWALIMAGGKGTRLAPLTSSMPKPLVPVAGRPIIEWLLLHLISNGVRRFVVSVGYLADSIIDFLGDGANHGCDIVYVREDGDRPLGTAGALGLVRKQFPEATEQPILMLNGDLVTQADVARLLDSHAANRSDITLGLRPYSHQVPFGLAELDESGRIVNLTEKPTWRGAVSAGIYVLGPRAVELVEPDDPLDAPDLIQRALDLELLVRGEEIVEDWQDVGSWRELNQARGLS